MKITRPEDIGALLRGYRADHHLTQTELASRLQTSQRWISQIENGKPTAHIGLVLRALNELGFSLDVTRGKAQSASRRRAKRHNFSIDDIVDA